MPDGDKIPPLPKGYEAITNTPPLPKGYFDVKKKDGSSDNGTDGIGGFSTQQSANGFDNLKNAIGDFHVQPQANSNASLGVDVGMKPVDTNAIKEQEQKTAKQAAINNAHDYFDNNQPLLEQLAKNNENLLEKDEEGKPIKGQYDLKKLEQTPIFNKKVNEILDASKNGNLAITKYQNGKKIGQPVFSKPAGFLESLGNSISNSFKQTKDAIVTKFKSPEEVADYFDKQRKDLPDVPESVPTGYGSMAGNAIGGIIKPAAEFSVGEGIFPGGGGLVTAAADIIPTTTSEKTKEIYYDRMNALEAKYGKDKVPENERLDAIHKALSQAPLQALPSEAMQLYLFGKGGNAANAEAIQSFGKVLKNAGADVGKMALAGGGSEIATQGIKQLQSGDGKFDDNISAAAGQWAMMEAAFKALPVTSKALGSVYSKFVNSNAKNVLATADPEVTQKLSEQAVQQGWLSQDQADEVQKDVQNFAKIKETIPTNIPENKAALVTGLIQKNESLEADKKTQNPIFHDDINAEIKANEQKAKDILNSSQPLKHEVDNLTGEKGVNTGGRPAKNQIADFADRVTKGEKMTSLEDLEFYDNNRNEIENELQAKKNQTLPASENNENGNSENGRLAPSEGSTNKKDVGETLQSQQEKVADIEKRRQEELSTVKPLNEALKVGGSFNYGDVKDAKIESIKKRGDVTFVYTDKGMFTIEEGTNAEKISKEKNGLATKESVNARYDAELAELKKQQPTTEKGVGEVVQPQQEKVDKKFTANGGNKVVDEKGEPLTLYHSTYNDFKDFKDGVNYFSEDAGYSKKIAGLMNRNGKGANEVETRELKTIPVNIKADRIYELPKGQEMNENLVNHLLKEPDFAKKYDAIKGVDLYSDNKIVYAVLDKNNISKIEPTSKPIQPNSVVEGDRNYLPEKIKTETVKPSNPIHVKDIPLSDIVLNDNVRKKVEQHIDKGVNSKMNDAPIVLKYSNDGTLEVMDGAHRFIQAERAGKKTIDAQLINVEQDHEKFEPNPKTNSIVEDKTTNENISQPEQENKEAPLDDLVHHEMPPTILSHRGLQEVSTEFGLGDVEKRTRKSDLQLRKDADNTIADWKEKGSYSKNVEGLISDAEKGEVLTDEERVILQDHLANLRQQLRDIGKSNSIHSTEFKSKWDEIYRVKQAGATTRSEAGAALRVGDNASVPDDTLEGYLAQEQDLNKGASLTDNQITTAVNEFSNIDAANNEFQQKYEDLQAKYAKLLAERELKKTQASTAKNTKKTHEDFVKERTDIVKDIREKLKKAREETSVTVVPYAKELIAIAPDVAKLAKSLIEEGVTKLEEVVKNIHGQLKDDLPELQEKDVHDILAGNYNEKKKTRNEITEQMQNLRIQAGLINRLEKLEDGEIPKNEKKKIERNQEIKDLRDKIKTHGLTKLSEIKSRNERELEKINQQLKSGNFEPPKKKTPLSQDDELKKNFPQAYKETLASQTKVYKARRERQLRMALRQFDNLSKRQKFAKNAVRYLNVPRTLMASMDYSAPLRQGLVATVAHPFTAAKAFAIMFKHGWSQEAFDRFYHEIHESPRWQLYQDSKLALTDPHSLHLNAQEEAFLGGNVAEKIPVLGKGVKASERAYVSYLNKMRIDLFDRFADAFEEEGKTYSNSPELYKALANYINSATGRGDLGFADAAAPLLNTVLFSPRLIASRINMLTNWMNPNFYRTVPKAVRVLYFQDMAKFIGVGVSFLALAKYGFGANVELDPRSSDFGKIKVGNTRWDIWGGFQQYIRVLAQLMTGQRKSQAAGIKDIDKQFGQNRLDILYSFARGKLAPIPSMTADILGGRTSSGQKINRNFDWNSPQGEESLTDEAINHLVPLIGSDVYAAMKEQGAKAIFTVGVPSTFGVGVQTYAPTPTKSKTSRTQVRQTPKRQVIQHR